MIREIRFRAWNTQEKLMYFDVQNCYDYMSGHGSGPDGSVVPATHFGELLVDDDWIVMQYTGLKDKNGQEIYEGDILEYQSEEYPDEQGDRYTVEWRVKEFAGVWEGDRECTNRDNDGLRGSTSNIIVIGNIFEDPDLLRT